MKNEWLTSPHDIQIQGLLDRYMRSEISSENFIGQARHLDEDLLAAFVEGNLGERETKPIVNHLVECSFCRHVTAELVRLDLAFAEEDVKFVAIENQPSRISEVLSGLLSRIFGTNDDVVFAHQEQEEKEEKGADEDKEK